MQIVRIGAGSTEQPTAEIVGGKAANLARMAALGLPVPPAFVLPIELCAAIVAGDKDAHRQIAIGLRDGIAFLESATGRIFGDRRNPLLVSVRSGAARSMPGMLDTVLNVGCSADAVRGLIRATCNPRFAWDCRHRFLESYADVVLGLDPAPFKARLKAMIAMEGVGGEQSLDGEALERLAADHLDLIDGGDDAMPDDPFKQLTAAANAVYRSWTSPRAQTYRRLEGLDDLKGTAVTVQAMVYGNRNLKSGAGVAFSRDPSTGSAEPVIDVLFGAQGEDVVSGARTPDTEHVIRQRLPAVATQLRDTLTLLERDFADVQDVEFTIEDGHLWILQTRAAKRTPIAALRFAIELVREGLITPAQGLQRLEGIPLDKLTQPHFATAHDPVAHGIGASAGIAVGRIAFDSDSAARLAAAGDPIILVRPDTSTADVAGFSVATGIVTAIGGRTAHAALVARQMGKPCVVGCAALGVAPGARAKLADAPIKEGDWLSIDGETGTLYLGRCDVVEESPDAELAEVNSWRTKSPDRSSRAVAP
ncbi:MAG: pyruvate, phosphate dikinase [Rhodopseudomonas sp.]|nr:pyruvate, phosphate dikinase [Rhodopseudomonas sp.]